MNCWISMIPPPTSLPRPISEWIKSTSLALKRSNFYVPDLWHCILFQRAKAKQPIINGYSGPGPEPPPGACGINASDFPLKLRLSVSLSSEICKRRAQEYFRDKCRSHTRMYEVNCEAGSGFAPLAPATSALPCRSRQHTPVSWL